MKICFVSHSSEKYGAERALLELLDALTKQGVECCVIVPRLGPLVEELEHRNLSYVVIPYKSWTGNKKSLRKSLLRTVRNLRMAIRIAATIKSLDCDVVYTNTITVCAGALAAKLLKRPHVWHIHEFGPDQNRQTFDLGQTLTFWLMNRLSTFCIANSQAIADQYKHD